jgi:hypothetical protein
MFATKSAFDIFHTEIKSNITQNPTTHRSVRENFAVHFLQLMLAQITFMFRVFTERTIPCDVGQNISNTNKLAFNFIQPKYALYYKIIH